MGALSDLLRAAAGQFQIHSPLGKFFTESAQSVDDLNQSANAPRLAPGFWNCDSTVSVGNAVYVSAANTVFKANASTAATVPAIGIVSSKPSPNTCFVQYIGELSLAEFAAIASGIGLVPGATYYLSLTTSGGITPVASGLPGQYRQVLGVAKNPSTLVIFVEEARLLSAA